MGTILQLAAWLGGTFRWGFEVSRGRRLYSAVTAAAGAAIFSALWAGDALRGTVSGEFQLRSGLRVTYASHVGRADLRDTLQDERTIVALTSSGSLHRLSFPHLEPAVERTLPARFCCLGLDVDRHILAGREDGKVFRVESDDLSLTEVASFPSAPVWVGGVRAADGDDRAVFAVLRREAGERPLYLVHDSATERIFKLVTAEGVPLRVFDGVGWNEREILLATDHGLRLFDCDSQELLSAPIMLPATTITRLARDGSGRLWLSATNGLWMFD
ncbi:MAG: hypothetical protein R3344_14175, partial [Acidobacteriota bacterium]|nr:hypothetical protein [Acidobacteriota bacterium]